ncbi:HupE/UreJ family protein [Spirosoma agri]|uniref:HupE/UreJ family protein n=2 Tax=Spirosoma agri TaxID=1987381 RepID=A0A6M0IRJ8_9BACT|nr:HupE/UreJ family protein [Spirosoma agri]
MPNSVVLLTIHGDRIDAEVQIPLSELQAAWGHAVNDSANGLVARVGPQLRDYLMKHIRPQSPDGRDWTVSVGALSVLETQNPINGMYRELVAQIRLVPPVGASSPEEAVRRFIFRYDVVLHQVVTHKILVSVRQDWARGQVSDEPPMQVGVIELDIINNRIPPLVVSLEAGSTWDGFRAMVQLGIRHISEGTDHLLFLLVLLLPAPLLVTGGPDRRLSWGEFGGIRYSFRRILMIVSAFTLGHSLTLLLGALGWIRLPGQPVEVLIALSILVSAVHAFRPLFSGRTAVSREAWVAAGFGLVHGLAFAGTLINLHLDAGPMALSILGFNLGIELMQVGIITLIIPWLLLLSQTPYYGGLRRTGAVLAGVAAIAWVIERLSGEPNAVTWVVEQMARQAWWLLGGLALLTLIGWWRLQQVKQLPFS